MFDATNGGIPIPYISHDGPVFYTPNYSRASNPEGRGGGGVEKVANLECTNSEAAKRGMRMENGDDQAGSVLN